MLVKAALLAAVLGLCSSSLAQETPPPPACPADYVLLGLRQLTIARLARLASTEGHPLIVGTNVGPLHVGRKVELPTATLVGRSVHLSSITTGSTVYCRSRRGTEPVGGCLPLTVVPVPQERLPLVQVLPGGFPVVVPATSEPSDTARIDPGTYRAVRIGRGRTLKLTAGRYDVGRITIARDAGLICAGDCTVSVHDGIRLGKGARLDGDPIDETTRARVRLLIAGEETALHADADSQVTAFAYAPAGTVHLGRRGTFTGTFVAARVLVGREANVRSVPRSGDECPSVLGGEDATE